MSDPFDAFRKQGEIDAATPLPVPINWKAHAERAERKIAALELQAVAMQAHINALTGELILVREALKRIVAMDPKGIRADDLGRAASIARAALEAKP